MGARLVLSALVWSLSQIDFIPAIEDRANELLAVIQPNIDVDVEVTEQPCARRGTIVSSAYYRRIIAVICAWDCTGAGRAISDDDLDRRETMEDFLQGLGAVAFTLLALAGLVVGALAGALTGRSKVLYAVIGAVAAIATPFLLAAIGVTVVAAGGVLLVIVVGAIGAALVVALVRAITHKR